MKTILIIEDDAAISRGLEESIGKEGYHIISAADGETGYQYALKRSPDLILLDLMLPIRDGIEVCRALRSRQNMTPIIILTSKNEEADKVIGLELGADDYITKPFSIRELLARIRAVLRRTETAAETVIGEFSTEEFRAGDLWVSFKKQEVRKNGSALKLSVTEFNVLRYLIMHAGEVISRDCLLDNVWGYDAYPTTRTVDNYILALRKKIEKDPANPGLILTVPKGGYKFVMPEDGNAGGW